MSVDLSKLEALVEPVAQSYGVELYDIVEATERGKRILRITVDVPGLEPGEGGVTIDQCAGISREVSEMFDQVEAVDGVYSLEVSSPGVERLLTKARHFTQAVGAYVRFHYREEVDGRREVLGILLPADGGFLRVAIRPKKKNLKKGQIEKLPPVEKWDVASVTPGQVQKAQTVYEL